MRMPADPSTTSDTTRRLFCRLGVAGLLSPLVGCGGEGTPSHHATDESSGSSSGKPDEVGTSSGAGGSTSFDTSETGGSSASTGTTTGADDSVCEPTASDIEGPFYRPGIPIGGNLDVHGDAGIPLVLSGRVLDGTCEPVANAVVEIWHATPVAPDGQPGDVQAHYDDTDAYRYYGQIATDTDGRYTFTTLKPGWYLNGSAYRPAHVHVKVWVENQERLTTQLYFAGDPFNASDPWYNPDLALAPDEDGNVDLDFVV